jgi:hypothetical protein
VREIWFQTQSYPELRNTVRDALLSEKHPSEKIVTLGVAGCELHNLFECSPRFHEVAALQSRETSAIGSLGLGKSAFCLGECETYRGNQR